MLSMPQRMVSRYEGERKDILLRLKSPRSPTPRISPGNRCESKAFQQRIEQRISLFVPPNSDIHLEGYVVAAGDGGGYAFGGTEFFLDIGIVDDIVVAQETTTHELYHAVQGALAADRELKIDNPKGMRNRPVSPPATSSTASMRKPPPCTLAIFLFCQSHTRLRQRER